MNARDELYNSEVYDKFSDLELAMSDADIDDDGLLWRLEKIIKLHFGVE